MSTTIHNPNKACCTIAPVVGEEYTPKGTYKRYGGFEKVYVTGNANSKKVIIYIFDVFGFSPQALQGADLLAQATDALVIQPDYFPKGPLKPEFYANKTEENQAAIQDWWGQYGDFKNHIPTTDAVLKAARDDGAERLGVVGFCFGGKVATITATDASKVDAVAVIHPARVSVEDAPNLAVPIAFFPSSGESEEECTKFLKALEDKPFASKIVEKRYQNMPHGWAGARANLKNEENLKEYKDVFERLSHFFNDMLVV